MVPTRDSQATVRSLAPRRTRQEGLRLSPSHIRRRAPNCERHPAGSTEISGSSHLSLLNTHSKMSSFTSTLSLSCGDSVLVFAAPKSPRGMSLAAIDLWLEETESNQDEVKFFL